MRQGITRRQALVLGGTALGAATLAACGVGGGTSAPKGKVTVTMFVFLGGDLGVMPKAFAKDYMASHPNVTVEIYEDSNTVGYPKMLAAKKTNPNQPLVNLGFFNAQTTAQGEVDGMWNKLDYSAMSNTKDILPIFKRASQQGIGISADQIGLVYNAVGASPAPTSWTDLWAARFKGKVTFFDYFWYPVFIAAKMNGGGLDNMEPGWAFWKQNAKSIRTIVTSNPQYLDVMSNGTAALTSYFNGTGLQWKRGGAPLEYVAPSEGSIPVPVNLTTVNGNTPDQEEVARDMVNEMLSAKWSLQWATTSVAVPTNTQVKLPPELAALPAFSKNVVDKFLPVDWGTVAMKNAEWRQRWDQDVKANI